LSVLTGGVDVERFSPVGPAVARTDLHRLLCLAPNPLPCNGFDIAIRALARVPDAELIVAETAATDHSHDEVRVELQQLATELGVADRVGFVGRVVGDDLPRLLRSADIVACTPREPPRATTVLQAMASGVAVVALPVGVLRDVVVNAVTGYVQSPSKPGELVDALRSLLTQRFLRESMGAAGRSRALSRFTWDRMAVESLTIYRQLTSPYTPPPARQLAGAR
jgi:glycosyltransferase involved in cell wall biosynthesis